VEAIKNINDKTVVVESLNNNWVEYDWKRSSGGDFSYAEHSFAMFYNKLYRFKSMFEKWFLIDGAFNKT
jgi:hypothetical protein